MVFTVLSGGFSIAGTLLAVAIAGATVTAIWFRWNQGDPSDWRANYLGEVTKRQEVEQQMLEQRELKHTALTEVAALKARTDLEPLVTAMVRLTTVQERSEDRIAARLEGLEASQKETALILAKIASHLPWEAAA
jgi:hypothetical protein